MLAGLLFSGGGHCRTCLADRLQQDRFHCLCEPSTAHTVDPSQTEDHGITFYASMPPISALRTLFALATMRRVPDLDGKMPDLPRDQCI